MDIHDVALAAFAQLIAKQDFDASNHADREKTAALAYHCAVSFMGMKDDYETSHPRTADVSPLKI